MNWYFYRILIPLYLLIAIAIFAVFAGWVHVNWWGVFVVWFFIGPIGIGVGFHRLFSHRQFRTSRFIEVTLGFLGTAAAYAPVLFWSANHQFHHTYSDLEQDPSSPKRHGFWESFFLYRLRENTLNKIDLKNYCVKKIILDPYLRFLSRRFELIVWSIVILLAFLGAEALISFYLFPVFIEHIRVNAVSSLSHMDLPFSYRNHKTKDDSTNNILMGYLTFGFAWHNNHHNDQRKLLLTENWWEIDIEGLLATLIRKDPKK
jgi:stearoyl-CoA desaturase (delta-9 desaturase)